MFEDPLFLGLFALVFLLIVLFSGVGVGIGIGVVSVALCYIVGYGQELTTFIPWVQGSSYVMSAVPLFTLMGSILLKSGSADQVYRGAGRLLWWFPGSLLHSNILSCAVFAAVSGSSMATAATMGTVAIPSLKARGYDWRLTLGSLAAGGTLGILIPPSITLIVYGSLSGVSIGRLFSGGVLPGIMMAGLFMLLIFVRVLKKRSLAPPRERRSLKDTLLGMVDMWPILVLAVVILGGIFGGVLTPTEAAAVGVIAALVIALARRRLTFTVLRESLVATVTITCMLLLIIIGAAMLGSALALFGTAQALANGITNAGMSQLEVILILCGLYVLLGCVMEGLALVVVTTPVIFPAIMAVGIDPVWWGVTLVVLVELGLMTPPVGINLYVIQGISGAPLSEVIKGTWPFFLMMVLGLGLLIGLPQIVTWLPNLLYGAK